MIRVSQPVTDQAEADALVKALERAYFGHAELVVAFEEALGKFLEAPEYQVVCVSSGTSALHLALEALGLGPGDEVLVPSLTFVASFQAVGAAGAVPVACEVRRPDLLLDLEDAERRITPRTKAVMPVHYAGNTGDLNALYQWAETHGLHVVEDAAHAFGSEFEGRKVGAQGEVICFSFDSLKNITCGEGGAVVCREPEVARRVSLKRLLGMQRGNAHLGGPQRNAAFDVVTQGYRYHMSNLCAAMGLVQLEKAKGFIARRRQIARRYDAALSSLPGLGTLAMDYDAVAPFLYVVLVPGGGREGLAALLRENDIETGINYPANHLHSLYHRPGDSLPVSEEVCDQILSLPLHCALNDEQVDRIIELVRGYVEQKGEEERP